MVKDEARCELWSRKFHTFQSDHNASAEWMQDAEQPDEDEGRRQRMIARAEFEQDCTFALLSLAKRKIQEFCG
jgi:hypothetical protein